MKVFRIAGIILSLVILQGCAGLGAATLVAVGMGTGAPQQPKVTRVQIGDVTAVFTDGPTRSNCRVYFDDDPALGCTVVAFIPASERSLNERLDLAEAAVGAALGDEVTILSRADQRAANNSSVQRPRMNETVILGFVRQ